MRSIASRAVCGIAGLLLGLAAVPRADAAACNTPAEMAVAGKWFGELNRAWEHLDADGAVALFTPSAEYRDDPFGPPQRGRQALHAYWDAVAQGQRDVHTSYAVLSACEGRSIVHWTASFIRVPSGQKVRLDGIAEFALDQEQKATLFHEWWNRQQD